MKSLRCVPDILTPEYCITYLEEKRWNGKPVCPYCDSKRATRIHNRYHCNNCNTAYSATVDTIFHHTHVPLHKWFWAIALILSDSDRISARQLAVVLDINKNTACGIVRHIQLNVKDIKHRDFLEDIVSAVNRYIDVQITDNAGRTL